MSILNAKQSRLLTRSQTVENFLTKTKDKYSILKPFEKAVNDLSENNTNINSLIPIRSQKGESATTIKKNLKTTIANTVGSICSLVIPYALDTENTKLYNAINHTTTDVIHMRDAEVFGFVTMLVGAIKPLLSREDFSSYPITAADLDALTKDAGNYNENLGTAKILKAKSSIASANINALLKANSLIIRKLNKLISYFKTKDPDFAEGYHTAAVLSKSGIHHSGIRGIIINNTTEQPIEAVKVILKGKKTTKTITTGRDGAYEIVKCPAGECKLTITASGCESMTIDVTIIRGKITERNISLQSQSINLITA